MRQSTVIFGTLLFAFVLFVTLRGDASSWLALFAKHGTHTDPNASSGSSGGSGGSSSASSFASLAATAATVAKVAAVFI